MVLFLKRWFSTAFLYWMAAILIVSAVFFIWCYKFSSCPLRTPQALVVPDVRPEIQKAEVLEKAGKLPEAVSLYEGILKNNPRFAAVYLKLGTIYFKLGLSSKAETAYLKALENGLNDPDVFLYLGYIKETQEKLVPALEYYTKAEFAASVNPVLYFNMGNVNAQLGNYKEALRVLKRAVVLNPDYMDAFVNLSIISAQMGVYADAQYYLEKAEKLGYHAPLEYKEGLKKYLRL